MIFSSFLADFIKSNNTTNSKLAEELQVPPATISHLLSGRNKPSIDFIQRLIKSYPTLDLYEIMELKKYNNSNTNESNNKSENKIDNTPKTLPFTSKNKKVKKIILLFEDNSFEEYN